MASQISTLLTVSNIHSALPLTHSTSLYKIFQSLFLIECPSADASALQNVQLNAAFLEYLSSQRVARVKLLLRVWWLQSLKSETTEDSRSQEDNEIGDMESKEEIESRLKTQERKWGKGELSDMDILDKLEEYIRDGVKSFCVCFDGQDVEAMVKMEEVRRKVDGILEKATSSFWPSFICQTREVL